MSVEAISVERGDLLTRAAVPPPESPHIVGYLRVGTVLEVGGGVDGRAIGERIVALNLAGSHAGKQAVPAAMTWPIPEGLESLALLA